MAIRYDARVYDRRNAYSNGAFTLPEPERSMCRNRKPRDESSYIDAAFRSNRTNEAFMFTGREYFVVKYDVDSRKLKNVSKTPRLISDGFKELSGTQFCTHGVDAAFGCYGTDTAFLFSGNWVVKIQYDLNNDGRLVELNDEDEGGTRMRGMFWFPGLIKDTKLFCEGHLDAACESTAVPGQAYLFKRSCYALIDYSDSLKLIREGRIEDEFTCLRNTVFQSEIRSAYASHTPNQLYLFKDNTYVLIEVEPKTRRSRVIAGPEEIVPTNWPCLEGLLPYKKDIGPKAPNEASLEYTDCDYEIDPATRNMLYDH